MSRAVINMRWLDRHRRPPAAVLPAGYSLRSWVDQAAFTAIQRSFGADVTADDWKGIVRDLLPDAMVFAFAPDGEPVAVALVRDRDDAAHAELSWVATVPGHRGQGLAQAVCAEATRLALDAGCLDLQLGTREDLAAAVHIYRKQGWVVDTRRRD